MCQVGCTLLKHKAIAVGQRVDEEICTSSLRRRNHFRVTLLPEASVMRDVFARIDRALARAGAKPGDTVHIGALAFDYEAD